MYSMGVPIGMFIDARGPRLAVVAGSVLLGLGYFPLRQTYDAGSGSVPFLCVVSYLTGLGGCMAFMAAVKTSALNWPHHRGTATAFPLAAFGLSAFFFSLFGSLIVPGDTSAFLLLLAVGTFALTLGGFFFLHVLPPMPHYHVVAGGDDGSLSESQQLRRTVSEEARHARRNNHGHLPEEPGRSPDDDGDNNYNNRFDPEHGGSYAGEVDQGVGAEGGRDASATHSKTGSSARTDGGGGEPFAGHYASTGSSRPSAPGSPFAAPPASEDADQDLMDETSSLVSKGSSLPGEVLVQNSVDMDQSHRVDIRGWTLLRNIEFWQLFAIMGILAGIGLMTIK